MWRGGARCGRRSRESAGICIIWESLLRPSYCSERVYARGVVCEKIRRAEEHPNT